MNIESPVAGPAPLAVYGGAFDPIHLGHLALARGVRDVFDAEVHLVPTGDPRHRDPAKASAQHRVAMLRLAIADEPGMAVDTREIERSGASYTIDTLSELRSEQGEAVPLLLTIGSDSFRGLPTWRRWRELIGLAHIVVALRSGASLDDLPRELGQLLAERRSEHASDLKHMPAGRIFVLPIPVYPQSSSGIRARIAAGESLDGEVPPAVADYIHAHRLYVG